MKRFVFIICTVCLPMMFMACSDRLTKEASKQMKITILQLANDPNAQISDTKTTFKTDSLIVMNCVVRGLNAFGGYARNDMEYTYAIRKDGMRMELVRNLDNEESVLEQIEDIYEEYGNKQRNSPGESMNEAEKQIEAGIYIQLVMLGRKVEKAK